MNGKKQETKVYAGGTVIAQQTRFIENNQTTDSIVWTTADPVTGTVGRFGGSGSSTEESEPLGQTIDAVDMSAEPEPPPSYEPPFGNASEPEWQCQVPLEFQPYHCQMRAEIANSLNGTGIQTIYDPEKKPGDPNFIHINDLSRAREAESGDDRLRTQTLHATEKPEDISHDGVAIQPSSVPSDDKKKKKKRQKPTLKTRGKNEPRPPVNVEDFEKPVQPSRNVDPPDFANESLDASLTKVVNLINLTANNVKLIGFNDAQENQILDRLFWMLYWKPCADAFRAAQIPTPAEVIRDRGLVLAHYDLLRSSSNNAKLGISEPERRRFIGGEILESQATTTDELSGRPVYTFYKSSAFSGGTYSLDEVVPHEMVHGAGVKKHYWYFLGIFQYGHDLDGYKPYEKILENCKLPKGAK